MRSTAAGDATAFCGYGSGGAGGVRRGWALSDGSESFDNGGRERTSQRQLSRKYLMCSAAYAEPYSVQVHIERRCGLCRLEVVWTFRRFSSYPAFR